LDAVSLHPVINAFWAHPFMNPYKDILVEEMHQQRAGVFKNFVLWSFLFMSDRFAPLGDTCVQQIDWRFQHLCIWEGTRRRVSVFCIFNCLYIAL
jgi:hypothetical protein